MKFKLLYLTFAISLLATAGSLFFSSVMHLPPCNLCWWQRICMYPLVYILGIGLALNEMKTSYFALGLALFGWIISTYHNLIYYELITSPIIPCDSGVSCTSKQIEWFGFLSIPLMSFIAFSLILILLILSIKKGNKYE